MMSRPRVRRAVIALATSGLVFAICAGLSYAATRDPRPTAFMFAGVQAAVAEDLVWKFGRADQATRLLEKPTDPSRRIFPDVEPGSPEYQRMERRTQLAKLLRLAVVAPDGMAREQLFERAANLCEGCPRDKLDELYRSYEKTRIVAQHERD